MAKYLGNILRYKGLYVFSYIYRRTSDVIFFFLSVHEDSTIIQMHQKR